jgi:superfamily II DNA or RNA helicase
MPVLEDLKRDFQFEIRTRGKQYYLDDAVHIQAAEPGAIKAQVTGGEQYRVEIRWEPMGIAYACTCPFFQDRDQPCKHVWATLLEADHQGVLDTAARRIEVANGGGRSVQNGHAATLAATPTPLKRRSLWQTQLEKIRDNVQRNGRITPPTLETEWPEDRRILYAIDVERSSRSLGGGVVVRLFTQKFTKAGKWGEPKRFGFTVQQWLSVPDETDRDIAQMLVGSSRGFFLSSNDPTIELAEWAHDAVLRRIVQSGRCHLSKQDTLIGDPIRWDDGPAYKFQVEVRADDRSSGHRLIAGIARGDESISLAQTSAIVAHGWVVFADRIARMEHFDAWNLLCELRQQEEMVIPSNDTEELLRELFTLPKLPALKLADTLGIRSVDDLPMPELHVLTPAKSAQLAPGTLQVDAFFNYGGQRVALHDDRVTLFDAAARTLIRRDRDEESKRWKQLIAVGVRLDTSWGRERQMMVIQSERLASAVMDLIGMGWNVQADGKAYRTAANIDVAVKSGIDWFDLDVSIDFGGVKAALPKLLKALSKGQKSILLDDGTVGLLPEEWLAKYALLAGLGTAQDTGELRFDKTQVGFLDAMIASLPTARFDDAYSRAREELASFSGIGNAEPVDSFKGELRDYQKEGLGWLTFLRRFQFGGCLADDMGLGKTVQVLAMLEARRREGAGTSLVVVPRSLVFNWHAEAARFTPQMRVLDYSGVTRDKNLENFRNYDLILTTYGTLRRDIAMLREFEFDYLILDESQAIKNAATASAKSVRLLRGRHRLAMSGTPIENHLGELWSLFEFLNPGMLGGANVFRTLSGGQNATPEGRQLIAKSVRPFILRRTKGQVAKELPERVEQTIFCELDEVQRKMYDELRDHYRVSLLKRVDEVGLGSTKIQVLEALLRLRQAACHPALFDPTLVDAPSAKLDQLIDQLAAINDEGHKALVFSQFTSFLALAKKQLDARGITYEYLDGQTNDRQAHVERFQNDPECRLFLISLKAGGVGLNLTAAEYVFLLDPWWNPAVEAQAIDRAHRIGQSRTVFAYRLIAKDTVEEKVLQLQSSKRELADAIINQDNSVIGSLTADDLKLLLS